MSLGSFSVDNNNDVACMETVELLLNRQGYRCINILGSLVSVAPGVTTLAQRVHWFALTRFS